MPAHLFVPHSVPCEKSFQKIQISFVYAIPEVCYFLSVCIQYHVQGNNPVKVTTALCRRSWIKSPRASRHVSHYQKQVNGST